MKEKFIKIGLVIILMVSIIISYMFGHWVGVGDGRYGKLTTATKIQCATEAVGAVKKLKAKLKTAKKS